MSNVYLIYAAVALVSSVVQESQLKSIYMWLRFGSGNNSVMVVSLRTFYFVGTFWNIVYFLFGFHGTYLVFGFSAEADVFGRCIWS
jgi:hypothetical protein